MKCATYHLIDSDLGCKSLQIGSAFGVSPFSNGLQLFIKDIDLTGSQFIGNVRKNYASIESTVMASFTFSTIVYEPKLINGVSVNGSKSSMSMSTIEAKKLILPDEPFPIITNLAKQLQKFLEDGTIKIGVNCWIYEVKLINNGEVYPIVKPSLVQVNDAVVIV